MPPSAGACQTTEADDRPDCGRAAPRSSIITAIGCRLATAGETGRPVSGAGTVTGVGTGVGVGTAVGLAGAVGSAVAVAVDPGVSPAGVAVGTCAAADGRTEAAGLPRAVAPMPTTSAETTTTPTIPMVAFRCIR